MAKRTQSCPDCGETTVSKVRVIHAPVGFLLVVLGLLLFFTTLGASFIISIYGVFMMVPRRSCPACGWRED